MEELYQHKKALGTNKIQHGSKHEKQREKQHGILTPVKPTCEEVLHRFNRRHRAGSREEALTG